MAHKMGAGSTKNDRDSESKLWKETRHGGNREQE